MPRPLYPRGNSPRYQLDKRSGETQSRSGRRGEVKILDPIGIRTRTLFKNIYDYGRRRLGGASQEYAQSGFLENSKLKQKREYTKY
jgi:hypothetical protein